MSPGARLKAAREQRGLSAQKAADEMHLDRWVIDALEADDYKRIGPTVYAKGHLKKYAALLGLPAEEILAGYESRSHGGGEAVLSGAGMMHAPRADAPQARHLKPLPMALSVAAVLLLVGVLWWRPWHQRGPLRSVPQAAAAISSSPVNELPDKAVGATGIPGRRGAATVRETAPAPVAAPSAPASAAAPAPRRGHAGSRRCGGARRRPCAATLELFRGLVGGCARCVGPPHFCRHRSCQQREDHRRRGAHASVFGFRQRRAARDQRPGGCHRPAILRRRCRAIRGGRGRRFAPRFTRRTITGRPFAGRPCARRASGQRASDRLIGEGS